MYVQSALQKNANLDNLHLSHTGEQALQSHNKEKATLVLRWEWNENSLLPNAANIYSYMKVRILNFNIA